MATGKWQLEMRRAALGNWITEEVMSRDREAKGILSPHPNRRRGSYCRLWGGGVVQNVETVSSKHRGAASLPPWRA